MSVNKRKATSGSPQLAETFEAINVIITRVKPKLTDLSLRDGRNILLEDLQHLAALAETLSERRQRSRIAPDVADALDREGTELWNVSKLVRQGHGYDDDQSLFAALRLSAFRLVEAGIEQKPGITSLINILKLASQTGAALAESGRNDTAAIVLGSAAKFEEQLRNTDVGSDSANERGKARAIILYYCSRMLAAWRDGNDAIAQFMLEKITESDGKRLALLSVSDRELLAAKILEIGKVTLMISDRLSENGTAALGDAKRALDAVKWLQKAFTLIEKMEDSESAGISDLKRVILRSLVRAYYLSSSIEAENLVRAEATLQELIASMDSFSSTGKNCAEHRQLCWMWLAVLRKRRAPGPMLLEAFVSIVDHTVFTEPEITGILQELRTVSHQHKLVSDVLQRCIRRVLDGPAEWTVAVDRLLLALIAHCARDQDDSRAIKEIEAACSVLTQSEYELAKTPAMACLTVLWKVGDRHFQMKKWSQAAAWFLTGTHKAFSSIDHMSGPKCLGKAALCYIEEREYAKASQIVQRCPTSKSSTFYLQFLIAVYQGREDDAVAAIQSIINAPDFDRKMLLLTTQLSHEFNMKIALLTSLEALLRTLRSHGPMDSDVEAICLARCIIRLVIRLVKETIIETERASLVSLLIRHFRTGAGGSLQKTVLFAVLLNVRGKSASALVNTAVAGKNALLLVKDVSWLWRTAYNVALQGCSEWQQSEAEIGDLFELSYELAHAYTQMSVMKTEPEVYVHMAHSAFSSLSARIGDRGDKTRQQTVILVDAHRAKEAIKSAKERAEADNQLELVLENFDELLHSVQIFEAEIFCQRQEWDKLLGVINEMGSGPGTLAGHEAVSDMLWSERDCPVNGAKPVLERLALYADFRGRTVLYLALESLLHSCLDCGRMSLEKFSRWLRAICTILLSRNSHSDRAKAVNYVEQALAVLEDQSGCTENEDIYPVDERHWLLSTTYNTGIECLASSNFDEAKRWFEAAIRICRTVPDGAQRSERISETYRRLLDQYAPQKS